MRPLVVTSAVEGWIDPADVFSLLFSDCDPVVWLDSGAGSSEGFSYIGSGFRTVTATAADSMMCVDGRTGPGSIFELLRTSIPTVDHTADDQVAQPVSGGFGLGWVGWLGYELRAETLGVPAIRASRYPDAALMFVNLMVVFDHGDRSMMVVGDSGPVVRALVIQLTAAMAAGRRTAATGRQSVGPAGDARVEWADSDTEYLALIEDCQRRIAEGDAYQLCLTTEVRVDSRPDPVATYFALRQSSPSHHGAFFRLGTLALISSSPELFLSVSRTGAIESHPIKGTRRRGITTAEDGELIAELRQSEKEQAENLMIVDLMRNDIARVSTVGSVKVPSLLRVETYAQVHQLVSTVTGQLMECLDPIDAVGACFPAGSMTGAPKASACEILDSLENRARGVYSGAFGYFSVDGCIELSMVIRSIMLDGRGATIGTGGGITALSVPEEELAEIKLKAAPLLAVLGIPADSVI